MTEFFTGFVHDIDDLALMLARLGNEVDVVQVQERGGCRLRDRKTGQWFVVEEGTGYVYLAGETAKPTCATCKRWHAFPNREESIEIADDVDVRDADVRKLGVCDAIGQEQEQSGVPESYDQAQVTDLYGCAGLRTSATFGCNLHEAKS